jgi:hypothetical protein
MSGGGSNPQISAGANPITWATGGPGPGAPMGARPVTVNGAQFNGTISASGNSDDFDVRDITTAMFSAQVGTPSGTTPTLDVYLDVKDIYGNYLQVAHLVQFTSTGAYSYAPVGPGTANTYAFTEKARFRWVIGGSGGPSYPGCGFALCGR